MQSSNHHKVHQKPNLKPSRKLKGKKKPQALRNAKARRSSLKSKLGV